MDLKGSAVVDDRVFFFRAKDVRFDRAIDLCFQNGNDKESPVRFMEWIAAKFHHTIAKIDRTKVVDFRFQQIEVGIDFHDIQIAETAFRIENTFEANIEIDFAFVQCNSVKRCRRVDE